MRRWHLRSSWRMVEGCERTWRLICFVGEEKLSSRHLNLLEELVAVRCCLPGSFDWKPFLATTLSADFPMLLCCG